MAGHQIMEDLTGHLRELTLYSEHNGDHRKALPRGVTWSELPFRKTLINFTPYDVRLQDP